MEENKMTMKMIRTLVYVLWVVICSPIILATILIGFPMMGIYMVVITRAVTIKEYAEIVKEGIDWTIARDMRFIKGM